MDQENFFKYAQDKATEYARSQGINPEDSVGSFVVATYVRGFLDGMDVILKRW